MTKDTISILFTNIRNANMRKHEKVVVPHSKHAVEVVKLLVENRYLLKYKIIELDSNKKQIELYLKYVKTKLTKIPVIQGIKRYSKQTMRIYSKWDEIPLTLNGIGTTILSTNKGIITDKKARELKIGGEIIGFCW